MSDEYAWWEFIYGGDPSRRYGEIIIAEGICSRRRLAWEVAARIGVVVEHVGDDEDVAQREDELTPELAALPPALSTSRRQQHQHRQRQQRQQRAGLERTNGGARTTGEKNHALRESKRMGSKLLGLGSSDAAAGVQRWAGL